MRSWPRKVLAVLLLAVAQAPRVAWAQSALPEVALNGSISSRSIQENENLQFTLSVRNKADAKSASLSDVTLADLPVAYELEESKEVCIVPILPPRTKKCESLQEFSAARNLLAKELAPGEAITVQGFLRPSKVHKTSTLTAVVSWSVASKAQPPQPTPSSQAVALGESQVLDSSWWGRLTVDEVLKALAIPALLLVLGGLSTWAFNSLNVWREDRASKAQKKLDDARHKAEEDRAVRAETWKQMLPVSHSYAAKFYLPLSLAAERFADSLKKPNPRLAFFYLLFCGKKMIATRNEIGGFYFKDLRGESLAAQCWKKQRLACLGEEDSPFYMAVLASMQQMEDIESFEAFDEMFADNSSGTPVFSEDCIQKAWTLFEAWMKETKKVEETLRYMRGFYAVLDYESNRPYQYWYDIPAKIKMEDDVKTLLVELLKGDGYKQEEIDEYFTLAGKS